MDKTKPKLVINDAVIIVTNPKEAAKSGKELLEVLFNSVKSKENIKNWEKYKKYTFSE